MADIQRIIISSTAALASNTKSLTTAGRVGVAAAAIGDDAQPTAGSVPVAIGIGRAGSSHGVDRAILASGVGGAGGSRNAAHLAHAHSNGARRGRKSDFRDAERLVHRLVAGELVLSYVPEDDQQGWQWLTRTRVSTGVRAGRVQSQIEGLLKLGFHVQFAPIQAHP